MPASIVLEFCEVAQLKGAKQKDAAGKLLSKHKDNASKLLSLKRCLKAWEIPFEGSSEIEYTPSKPPTVNKFFNADLYPKASALCELAYLFEQNGIVQEHAHKLSLIFKDEKILLDYVYEYANSARESTSPLHDFCLYSLPDFSEPGFLDDKGCVFGIFQTMANQQQNILKPEFRELLAFAWEIQKHVVAARGAVPKDKVVNKDAIEKLSKEIKEKLARFDALEHKKARLNEDEEEEYDELAETISEMLRELAKLIAGKMLKDLSLLELRAVYEQIKFNTQGAYRIFVENGIPAQFYAKFKTLDRSRAGENIPDVKIDGADFGYPGYYMMKLQVQDEVQAARAATLGKRTGCCQSYSGEAGQPCVVHGLTSPNGGFYVLCKGDVKNPKVDDPEVAQSWAWRSKTEAIGFDSIEVNMGQLKAFGAKKTNDDSGDEMVQNDQANNKPDGYKMVQDFYEHLTQSLVERGVKKVFCGASSGISGRIGINANMYCTLESFKDYDVYCDSATQRQLHDASAPFIAYDISSAAKKQVTQIINQALQSSVSLSENTQLVKLINWAVLEKKEDVIAEIKALASPGRLDEVNLLIENIREFVFLDFSELINDERLSRLGFMRSPLIHTIHSSGKSFLRLAVESKNTVLCLTLIANGADVNATKVNDESILVKSILQGLPEVCLALIKKGALVNVQGGHPRRSALELAIQNGHPDVSIALIENGADVNVKDEQGTDIIMQVMQKGYVDVCLALINTGADVNAKNKQGSTILMEAAQKGYADVCLALIKKGANVNAKSSFLQRSALDLAIQNGHQAVVLVFTDNGEDLGSTNEYGQTILMRVAQRGLTGVCEKLIQKGANVNSTTTRNLETPLMLAAQGGHADTCLLLIDKGADVGAKSRAGKTALMAAAQMGLLDVCIKLIEKGEDVNQKDIYGTTPLIYAAREGRLDVCMKLIEMGADTEVEDTSYHRTALMEAAAQGHREVFSKLFEKSPYLKNTKAGQNLLLFAARSGLRKICLTLIESGIDVNAKSDDGMAVLLHAIMSGDSDVCLALIEKGADVKVVDKEGKTTLMLAAEKGLSDVCLKLIEKGVNIEVKMKDVDQTTALMIAAKRKMVEVFLQLVIKENRIKDGVNDLLYLLATLDNIFFFHVADFPSFRLEACKKHLESFDVHVSDNFGTTTLMFAAQRGYCDVCLNLINRAADVNAKDSRGTTALMFAAENGSLDVCVKLIENGADLTIKDNFGKCALDYARKNPSSDVCLLLERKTVETRPAAWAPGQKTAVTELGRDENADPNIQVETGVQSSSVKNPPRK